MACLTVRYLFICLFLMIYDEIEACESSRSKTLKLRDDDGLPYYYFQGTSYSPESTYKNINKNSPDGATWCPDKSKIKNSFLEVDLGKQYLLCGVSTQGDSTYGFTKSYKIEISSNRVKWKFYQKNGTDLVIKGNENSTTMVYHPLNLSAKARFVRFDPDTYETNACMRVELYGEEIKKEKCEKTVIDVSVPEIVVTSFPNISATKVMPILNGTEPWCWSSNFTYPYLKFDFGNYSVICGMRFSFNERIKVSYGNESSNTSLVIYGSELFLPVEKILTDFLQFKPIGNSSCLSVKMFGYLNEEYCGKPHPLGLSFQIKDKIPDNSIKVSSQFFSSSHARLRDPKSSWCAIASPSEWIRVDLGQVVGISGIASQGYKFGKVTEYEMRYSYDGKTWYG